MSTLSLWDPAFLAATNSAAAAWNPARITTEHWLDASDPATITTVSGAVSQWNDKSGNARNATQSTTTKRPILTSNGLNGLSVITFDGSDDFMQFNGVHDANWSLAAVVKLTQKPTFQHVIVQFQQANTKGSLHTETGIYIARPAGSSLFGARAVYTTTLDAKPALVVTATYATSGAAGTNIWLDGTMGTPDSGAGVSSNGISYIGAFGENVPPYNLKGFIAEIIVTNGVDSTESRERKEGYLAWKWGLQGSLPAGHPYKNARP